MVTKKDIFDDDSRSGLIEMFSHQNATSCDFRIGYWCSILHCIALHCTVLYCIFCVSPLTTLTRALLLIETTRNGLLFYPAFCCRISLVYYYGSRRTSSPFRYSIFLKYLFYAVSTISFYLKMSYVPYDEVDQTVADMRGHSHGAYVHYLYNAGIVSREMATNRKRRHANCHLQVPNPAS